MVNEDENLIETYPAPEIFIDGFMRHRSRKGVMTCVGYREIDGNKVIVVRLAWPVANTGSAIDEAIVAMAEPEPIEPPRKFQKVKLN